MAGPREAATGPRTVCVRHMGATVACQYQRSIKARRRGRPGTGQNPQVSTKYQKQAFQNHGYDPSRPTLQGATCWGTTAGGGETFLGSSCHREIRAPQESGGAPEGSPRRRYSPTARHPQREGVSSAARPPPRFVRRVERLRSELRAAPRGGRPYWRRCPAHFLCGESGATLWRIAANNEEWWRTRSS